MAEEGEGRPGEQDQGGTVLDKCTRREDIEFGRAIRWLRETGQTGHTRRGQTLIIRPRLLGKREGNLDSIPDDVI